MAGDKRPRLSLISVPPRFEKYQQNRIGSTALESPPASKPQTSQPSPCLASPSRIITSWTPSRTRQRLIRLPQIDFYPVDHSTPLLNTNPCTHSQRKSRRGASLMSGSLAIPTRFLQGMQTTSPQTSFPPPSPLLPPPSSLLTRFHAAGPKRHPSPRRPPPRARPSSVGTFPSHRRGPAEAEAGITTAAFAQGGSESSQATGEFGMAYLAGARAKRWRKEGQDDRSPRLSPADRHISRAGQSRCVSFRGGLDGRRIARIRQRSLQGSLLLDDFPTP